MEHIIPIVGFPGYAVSIDGRVWTNKGRGSNFRKSDGPWREMKAALCGSGPVHTKRLAVGLRIGDGKRYTRYVARLVLEAFVGPCPPGMQACHNDGNPLKNHLDNLRWDTLSGNQQDRIRHGTDQFGENNPGAKLTREDIKEIFRLRGLGLFQREIADRVGTTRANIGFILQQKTWNEE